jgi:SAM-dependent methyltransferase
VGDHDYHRALWFRRTELKPGGFSNQLFFEAGCGMGRYLRVVGEDPTAEVVGLDLSQAALRAYAENKHNPRIHVVQGNILQMPFRPEIFDHAYSIGVLHHTPSTEMAFRSMARLVKPGGRATVWLYHVWRSPDMKGLAAVHAQLKGAITDGLRAITTRMPHALLEKFCYLAVPVGWMQRKIMNGPAPLKALLSPMLLVNCSVDEKWQVRVCDTFDWYSPMYQWKHTVPEVAGWFKSLGMTDISTQGFPVSVRGTKPKTQAADDASSQGRAYHLRSS